MNGSGSKTLEALDRGRSRSLDRLYRRYADWLRGLLRHRHGLRPDLAEDLVQEAYIRIARYDVADANRHPQALLRQIAVNLARDHMRRNVVSGGLDGPWGPRPEEASEPSHQDTDLLLEQIILSLPPIYRDVFTLSRFTAMTYEDIACHLGIAVKTVEWRMSKALALCTEQMQG